MGRRRGATADGAIVMVVWEVDARLPLVEVADSEDGDGLGADGAPLLRI